MATAKEMRMCIIHNKHSNNKHTEEEEKESKQPSSPGRIAAHCDKNNIGVFFHPESQKGC